MSHAGRAMKGTGGCPLRELAHSDDQTHAVLDTDVGAPHAEVGTHLLMGPEMENLRREGFSGRSRCSIPEPSAVLGTLLRRGERRVLLSPHTDQGEAAPDVSETPLSPLVDNWEGVDYSQMN